MVYAKAHPHSQMSGIGVRGFCEAMCLQLDHVRVVRYTNGSTCSVRDEISIVCTEPFLMITDF